MASAKAPRRTNRAALDVRELRRAGPRERHGTLFGESDVHGIEREIARARRDGAMMSAARARFPCGSPRRQGCGESTTSNESRAPRRPRAPRRASPREHRGGRPDESRARGIERGIGAAREPRRLDGAVMSAARARFPCESFAPRNALSFGE